MAKKKVTKKKVAKKKVTKKKSTKKKSTPPKVGQCCSAMRKYYQFWPAKGIVLASFVNRNTEAIRHRLLYKPDGRPRGPSIYLNFCPWCGTQVNEDYTP